MKQVQRAASAPSSRKTGTPSGDPLHIALVTETFAPEINGVAMTAGRIVNGLQNAGHKVHIVRPRQPGESSSDPADTAAPPATLVAGLSVPGYNGIRFGLPAGARLYRAWQQQRPDLVHVLTEGPLGRSAVRSATRLGLPVVGGYHTHFDRYTEHYRFGFLRKSVTRYLVRFHNRCHINLAPTRELADELSRLGMREVRVMSRGVDRVLFNPLHRSQALRAGWGAGEDGLVMMCVGRLAAEKQLDLVIRAWQAARAGQPRSRLVLVGGGPEYQRLCRSYPDVILTGPVSVSDLSVHYASADLFVFASMSETFGNVVQEALASGVPVVGFNYAAARELMTHGEHGLLVPFADEEQFIRTVARAARDLPRLRRMGLQARELGRSWAGVIEELISDYQDAIALASSSPARRASHATPVRNT